jgi:hypothetical protein
MPEELRLLVYVLDLLGDDIIGTDYMSEEQLAKVLARYGAIYDDNTDLPKNIIEYVLTFYKVKNASETHDDTHFFESDTGRCLACEYQDILFRHKDFHEKLLVEKLKSS